jgi:hypothetical protein
MAGRIQRPIHRPNRYRFPIRMVPEIILIFWAIIWLEENE